MRAIRLTLVAAIGAVGCQADELNLSETEQAIIGVAFSPPSGQNLGSIQVGQSSSPLTITISPSGLQESYTEISSVLGCTGFTVQTPGPGYVQRSCMTYDCSGEICPVLQALPTNCLEWYPDVTYSFTTRFNPTLAQAYSCALSISTSLGARTYSVAGTGTSPPLDIDVTPPGVAFGDVRRNTPSSPATITVRNAGSQALTVTGVTVTGTFAITAGPTGNYPLAVGATQPYQVTCNPTATGTTTGQFRVTSNDPATPTATVALSCNGIDSALDITPSPLTVTTRVGEPVDRSFQLTNSGGASMQLQTVNVTGSGLTPVTLPSAGMTLGASGGTTTATIHFDATTAGEATGTLAITYDGGQTRTVAITARAQETSMSLVPDGTYDFGPVCIGQSNTQDVVVSANAEGAFLVNSVSIPQAPFTATVPTLPATIMGAGGNQLVLGLKAEPTTEGESTSTIDIATDIPNGGARTMTLTVTGLPAGVNATPAELDLGQSMVNSTTIGQGVEVSNCGTAPVALSNARIEGEHAGDFAVVAEPSLMVPANGKARWLIIAQPHAVGPKTATFSVDHPGGTTTVNLIANGVGDGMIPDEGGVRPSYYACSTGSASSAWPLAFVLVPLLRRRRR